MERSVIRERPIPDVAALHPGYNWAGALPTLRPKLLLHPRIKSRHIDDDPLVRAVADRLLVVARLDPERERAAIDADQLCGRAHPHADRRGCEVAHVEMDAEALMPRGQEVLDRRKRRRLDDVDHDRR